MTTNTKIVQNSSNVQVELQQVYFLEVYSDRLGEKPSLSLPSWAAQSPHANVNFLGPNHPAKRGDNSESDHGAKLRSPGIEP